MHVTWRLFATLGEAAGDNEVSVDVSGDPTVATAIEALFEAYPVVAEEARDDEQGVYEHVRTLHDGEDVEEPLQSEREVTRGDELALFPPVSGG
ncbi:ubiquitin-like small modifier protein 1 [Halorhabdus sp. CUG00001]|uniref:ubiquitin-like small modifier protein 1 n=1 Tax=Halorhabdus sp. CUG00001 TaxID=2600297 RepID=UPI00131C782A|nr:ubiquitin-like small modifier protein 1 [Halorhabdus sp. CUG00001]